ncbi:MAG: Mov34/MPN/PAD-1 family protein [Acidobacteria bacterium]|nr:Mov34/MPN/PAD-1 family protein [Acidobacteriota bacterium]
MCRSILEELSAHERRPARNESGGILLGLVFKDHDEIIELGAPIKTDKAKLFSFTRRKSPAQRKINYAWNTSGGHVVYLGEWHTHPGSRPTPSTQDRKMIENALRTTLMEIEYLYLVIAGDNRSFWVGRQDRSGLSTLKAE